MTTGGDAVTKHTRPPNTLTHSREAHNLTTERLALYLMHKSRDHLRLGSGAGTSQRIAMTILMLIGAYLMPGVLGTPVSANTALKFVTDTDEKSDKQS